MTKVHVHGPATPAQSVMPHLFNVFTDEPDVIAAGVDRTTDSFSQSVPLADIVAGTASQFDPATVLRHMYGELGYVNYHSQMWPAGEIRANLVLVASSVASTKHHELCMSTLNKQFATVAKAIGKDIFRCMKDGGDIEACIATQSDKVTSLKFKTGTKFVSRCGAFDNDGALRWPPFGATDDTTVNTVADDKELQLIRDIYGNDLNTTIGPATSGCQVAVTQRVQACQDTKVKWFNKCKKAGMKGKEAPAGADLPFDDATDIELCMGHDPKSKISKACVTRTDDTIGGSKCVGTDLSAAFPGCGTSDPGVLGDCLDRLVECRVCLALNTVDNLARDCDDFDDGVVNGSCVP
jgi:hypothetical protein